jgi:tetratricopeptide (TPR) repeat protein
VPAVVPAPTSARQAIAHGDAYLGAKDYRKAQAAYRAALELEPANEEAYYKLGLSFALALDFAQAASAFERVLALNPKNTSARQNLERARSKLAAKAGGSREEAFDAADAAYQRGVSLMSARDYLGALAAFDETLRYRQDHALCYVARGTAYVSLRDPQRAVLEYKKSITFDQTLASPYYGLAEAYKQMGDKTQALRYYQLYVGAKGRDKDPATVERAQRWVEELSR